MNDQPPADPALPGFVPVCAIGASAGGVGALQTLFRLLPDDLGLAYVVVVHLAPDHPSAMHEIIGACTKMPVHQITDGSTLRANCVYVIAPDRELVIDGDDVQSRPFTDPRGKRAPIDMFFRSIAAGRGDGIAVVLTGAGSDGALGVRAIKEAGGIVMVQEPAEAGYPSMPQNAIATGVADVVAPLARLAERIAEAARSKEAVRSLDGDGAANDIRRIVAFLRTRTGHDFSGYKRSTVLRRIQRRMQVCLIDSPADYLKFLRENPEEAKELLSDLLISVTMFFRDPETFVTLSHRVVRPLLEARSTGETDDELRAWVVGCATGEEAYSLAILLLEEADQLKVSVPIQIFATDLDEGALATAREGRYPRSIEADVSDERLKRFFVNEGTHYRISREVRDLILFATHSVVREPPFMRLDLITCRNVLIYLERALQQQVNTIFRYGLKTDGYLFLGTAETADTSDNQFAAVDRDARIYRALPTRPDFLPTVTAPGPWNAGRPALTESRLTAARLDAGEVLGESHAAALEASAPPSALIDGDQNVLHLSPSVGRFILLSAGPLSGRLPSIVRPELRLDLKLALDRAFDGREPTITRPLDVTMEGGTRRVSLHVTPLPLGEGSAPRAMVYFLDSGPGQDDGDEAATPPDELKHLHSELKVAQEAELAGRIRHESAVQELRASNEELQSLNEEYRSTAEELETSKEELQSINEELQTVNAELKSKLRIISSAHNDLQNLTASSEIGTLFLDLELRIRMFTPPVAELINIADGDVGRPITNFTHRLYYDDVATDVRRVLRDLASFETEVRTTDNRWFTVRMRPYRTTEGKVEGAVITFDDVTARIRAEQAQSRSVQRFQALAATAGNTIYHMSADWRLMYQLDSDTLARTPEPIEDWVEKYILESDLSAVRAAIAEAIRTKSMFELEHRVRQADGTVGWVLSRAVPLLDGEGEIAEWFGAGSDVTDRKRAEAALRESENRHSAIHAQAAAGFAETTTDGRFIRVNPEYCRIVGRSREELLGGLTMQAITHPDDRPSNHDQFINAVGDGAPFEVRKRYIRPDGSEVWVHNSVAAIRGADGRIASLHATSTDVSRAMQAEIALRESELRQRLMVELVPALLWSASPDGESIAVNEGWMTYTGQSEAETQDFGWLDAIHPDDLPGAQAAFEHAFATGEPIERQQRIRKAGNGYRWHLVRHVPVRNADGEIDRWFGAAIEIDELHRLQDRQQVMVKELQHRTRNLITVVNALSKQTLSGATSLQDFEQRFNHRLAALSRVQGLLSRLSAGRRVAFDELLGSELSALGAPDDKVTLDGPTGVPLRSASVQTFSLALHELATNALKYGALSAPDGHLTVRWLVAGVGGPEPRLQVDWRESGVAMTHVGDEPRGGGYGRELIERALPYQLDAETSYEMTDDGVHCTIDVPISTAQVGTDRQLGPSAA